MHGTTRGELSATPRGCAPASNALLSARDDQQRTCARGGSPPQQAVPAKMPRGKTRGIFKLNRNNKIIPEL